MSSFEAPVLVTPRPRRLGLVRDFFELGKFRLVELWLGFFIAVTRLLHGRELSSDDVVVLGAILVAGVAVIAATCALDDVTGVRDGVDQANHREARYGVNKPILEGRLSERRALGFTAALAVVIVAGLGTALTLSWPRPPWFVLMTLGMMLLALNYSWGLKLSYRGAGELVVGCAGAGTVLVPFGLVADELGSTMLLLGLLVGLWNAQIVVFSNTVDRVGDRAQGRMTLAARLSEAQNKRFIRALFVLGWATTVAGFGFGWLQLEFIWVLGPVMALQGLQLWRGTFEGRWLEARRMGFIVLRYGILGVVATNLVARALER